LTHPNESVDITTFSLLSIIYNLIGGRLLGTRWIYPHQNQHCMVWSNHNPYDFS